MSVLWLRGLADSLERRFAKNGPCKVTTIEQGEARPRFLKRSWQDITDSSRPLGPSPKGKDASFDQRAAPALLASAESGVRQCGCHTICACALSNVAATRLKHEPAMRRAAWKPLIPSNLGNNIKCARAALRICLPSATAQHCVFFWQMIVLPAMRSAAALCQKSASLKRAHAALHTCLPKFPKSSNASYRSRTPSFRIQVSSFHIRGGSFRSQVSEFAPQVSECAASSFRISAWADPVRSPVWQNLHHAHQAPSLVALEVCGADRVSPMSGGHLGEFTLADYLGRPS